MTQATRDRSEAKSTAYLNEDFVVTSIFPKALSIADYVALISAGGGDETAILLTNANDKRAFVDFCTTDVFIVPEDAPVIVDTTSKPHMDTANSSNERKISLKDLLNRFVVDYVRGAKYDYRTQNCLTFGYRLKSEGSVGMTNNMDIECLHLNTLHSILLSSPSWSLLAYRLGETLFSRILARPVVARLPNGCFMQLCGTSVSNLVYNTNSSSVPEAHTLFKYQHGSGTVKTSSLLHSSKNAARSVADQSAIKGSSQVPRYGIFYKNIYQRYAGLPKRHIMSKRLTNGEQLAAHVFGKYVVPVNAACLKEVFRHVLRNLKSCDIHKALKRYCPLPSNGGEEHRVAVRPAPVDSSKRGTKRKGTSMNEADLLAVITASHSNPEDTTRRSCDDEDEDEGDDNDDGDDNGYEDNEFMDNFTNTSRKRSRRGCRGSGFVRRKQRSHASNSVSAGAASNVGSGSRRTKRQRDVGGRLLSRFMKNSKIDVNFRDEGLQSQQEDLDLDLDTGYTFTQDASSMCGGEEEDAWQDPSGYGDFVYEVTDVGSVDANIISASNIDDAGKKLSLANGAPSSIPSTFTSDSGTAHHILLRKMPVEPSLSTASPSDGAPLAGKSRQRFATAEKIAASHSASSSASHKTEPISCHSPLEDVCSFVKSICRRTLSRDHIWGSRKNLKVFMRAIDTFVSLGRQETVTVERLRRGISLSDLPFFVPGSSGEVQRDNQRMLDILFYWIFSDFVSPLLGVCFYVTEAEGRGNAVFYYRKPVWSKIVQSGRDQIYKHFVELKIGTEGGLVRKIGRLATFYSSHSKKPKSVSLCRLPTIRFVPKKFTVRPITNFRRRPNLYSSQGGKASFDEAAVTNSALNNCLQILKHVCQKNPHLAGFGAFGADEIYAKLRRYKATLQENGVFDAAGRLSASAGNAYNTDDDDDDEGGDGKLFYFAVLDLEKCYDNVDTSLLYNLVRDLLHGEDGRAAQPLKGVPREAGGEFVVQKYSVSHRITSMEKSVSKPLRHVAADGDIVDFRDASSRICTKVSNAIISDYVQYSKLSVSEVLAHVRDHLFMHYVKMPFTSSSDGGSKHSNVYGEQVKGIPQGSVLSSLLCNLYYGNAERIVFGPRPVAEALGLVDQSLVIRYMDDYIMISLRERCVQQFLQRAHVALRAFGGGVNAQKTRVNFDCEIELDGSRVALQRVEGRDVHWCGYSVDTHTLEVRPSFRRLLEVPLTASINADRGAGSAGLNLRRNIKTFIRMKSHALLFDSHINSRRVALLNVYTTFLLAAMRAHCYVSRIGAAAARNGLFLGRCVEEGVLFGVQLIRGRMRAAVPKPPPLDDEGEEEEEEEEEDEYSYFESAVRGGAGQDLGVCHVSRQEARWLGTRAFLAALGRHRSIYKGAITRLSIALSALRRTVNASEADMRAVCAEGDTLMDLAVW